MPSPVCLLHSRVFLTCVCRFSSDDLYDDARGIIAELNAHVGVEGDEPLYVDMFDANVPSAEWIAREEERHRLEVAGVERLSNEEFGELRIQARCVLLCPLLSLLCVFFLLCGF